MKKVISFFLILVFSCCFVSGVLAISNDKKINPDVKLQIPDISAKSAVVMEANTGQILIKKDCDKKMPISHLTKLMTLLLTAEALENGKLKLDTVLTTSPHANSMGDPQVWLNAGEKINVDELIKSITVGNGNDASVVLAEGISGTEANFVIKMNEKAKEMKMKNTNFVNCTGIDSENHYSTASDLAILSKEILKYKKLQPYLTTWMTDVRQGQTNLVSTNKLVRFYKGCTGLKAAASKNAGQCLIASAIKGKMHLICVLLNCADTDSKNDDAKNVFAKCTEVFTLFEPEIPKEKMFSPTVKKGQKQNVKIKVFNDAGLIVQKTLAKQVESDVMLETELEAPIKEGQVVGKIDYKVGDTIISTSKIITTEGVKRISINYCFKHLLNKLLKM